MKYFSLRAIPSALIALLVGMSQPASAFEYRVEAPRAQTAAPPYATEGEFLWIWDEDRGEWILTWVEDEN